MTQPTITELRSRALAGRRLSGDDFGRLLSAGEEALLYHNAEIRERERAERLTERAKGGGGAE